MARSHRDDIAAQIERCAQDLVHRLPAAYVATCLDPLCFELLSVPREVLLVSLSRAFRRGRSDDEGAAVTIQALELGAVDFALKTAARGTSAVRGLITELAEKIRQAATT